MMRFIETPVFTKELRSLIPDDDYGAVQIVLALRPEQGVIIRGTGGIRKIRWGGKGRGKRGGLRFIYYWDKASETIYMLYMYRKNKQDDLTPKQCRLFSRFIREELK